MVAALDHRHHYLATDDHTEMVKAQNIYVQTRSQYVLVIDFYWKCSYRPCRNFPNRVSWSEKCSCRTLASARIDSGIIPWRKCNVKPSQSFSNTGKHVISETYPNTRRRWSETRSPYSRPSCTPVVSPVYNGGRREDAVRDEYEIKRRKQQR